MNEGDQVVFCGPGWTEPARGRLIATAGTHGQVRWDSGAYAGQITLAALDDLMTVDSPPLGPVYATVGDLWDDSLAVHGALEPELFERDAALDDDEFLFGFGGDDGA